MCSAHLAPHFDPTVAAHVVGSAPAEHSLDLEPSLVLPVQTEGRPPLSSWWKCLSAKNHTAAPLTPCICHARCLP